MARLPATDEDKSAAAGTLYVVATPIGNLSDTSTRALDTLRSVDRIAAEDTRRTRALLAHFQIRGPRVDKIDANSSDAAVERLVQQLVEGRSIALVTDAGTPSVSDPGARLVRAAAAAYAPVIAIPGPSAVTAAVAVSGLVEGPFYFMGFLPRKGEKRQRALARIAATAEPVVLFEAPNRLHATLKDLAAALPERSACVCREITKLHEQTHRGTLTELAAAAIPPRGEITLVLGPHAPEAADEIDPEGLDDAILERLGRGDSAGTIARELAPALRTPRRLVYARVLSLQKRR